MDFSAYISPPTWTWLAVLRQCFSSRTAADGHTRYKAGPSQNWPKITTYDHVHQIFITSCDLDVKFCVTGALKLYVTWWRHEIETFSALLVLCEGNPPATGEFPSQRTLTQSLDDFFDLRLNKHLVINPDAGDLRLHCAHYDVTVMSYVAIFHRRGFWSFWLYNNPTLKKYPREIWVNEPYHDDVIKWKHFPRYWPFVRGIHRSPVNSPHKGQWRGALMFTLICARINGWVNNR